MFSAEVIQRKLRKALKNQKQPSVPEVRQVEQKNSHSKKRKRPAQDGLKKFNGTKKLKTQASSKDDKNAIKKPLRKKRGFKVMDVNGNKPQKAMASLVVKKAKQKIKNKNKKTDDGAQGLTVNTKTGRSNPKRKIRNKKKNEKVGETVEEVNVTKDNPPNYENAAFYRRSDADVQDSWESTEYEEYEDSENMRSNFSQNNATTSTNKNTQAHIYQSNVTSANKNTQSHFYQNRTSANQSTDSANSSKECQNKPEEKQMKIDEPLGVTLSKRDTVVVAIAPQTTIYFQGMVKVKALVGTVEIFGYTIKEGETQTVHSLPSMALLGMKVVEGCTVQKSESKLASLGLSDKWLQDILKEVQEFGMVEFETLLSPLVPFLRRLGQGRVVKGGPLMEPWNKVGASLVTPHSNTQQSLIQEGSEWREIADTIRTAWKCGSTPHVVICGGKGVGKSTFFKFITNYLLSDHKSGLLCLDFDPGQSEFSLPTCLSLVKLTQPILGPPFVYHITELAGEFRKQILLGATSPQFALHRYMNALKHLYKLSTQQFGNLPLIVNTMGWTEGTGLGIMVDVLRTVKPTHVIEIKSGNFRRDFSLDLSRQVISKAKEGITTRAREADLHYSLTKLNSVTSNKRISFAPKDLRELRVIREVNHMLHSSNSSIVKVPWSKVGIHICEERVPRNRLLQVINGQLVSLCNIKSDYVETIQHDLPKHVSHNSGLWEALGWGIVKGVDPMTRELYIHTSLSAREVEASVKAVILPRVHLPLSVYKYFFPNQGAYVQVGQLGGAARLRVGRQIKPRGRKKN